MSSTSASPASPSSSSSSSSFQSRTPSAGTSSSSSCFDPPSLPIRISTSSPRRSTKWGIIAPKSLLLATCLGLVCQGGGAEKIASCRTVLRTFRKAQGFSKVDEDTVLCEIRPHWDSFCLSDGLRAANRGKFCTLLGPLRRLPSANGILEGVEFAGKLDLSCLRSEGEDSDKKGSAPLDVVIKYYNDHAHAYRDMAVRAATLEDPVRCRFFGGLVASTDHFSVFEAFSVRLSDVLNASGASSGLLRSLSARPSPKEIEHATWTMLRHLSASLGIAYQYGFPHTNLESSDISLTDTQAGLHFALLRWDLMPIDLSSTSCATLDGALAANVSLAPTHPTYSEAPASLRTPALYADSCALALLTLRFLENLLGLEPQEDILEAHACDGVATLRSNLERGVFESTKARIRSSVEQLLKNTDAERPSDDAPELAKLLEWMIFPNEGDCFDWAKLEERLGGPDWLEKATGASSVPKLVPGYTGIGGEAPRWPWWRATFAKREKCLPKPPKKSKKGGAFAEPPPGFEVDDKLLEVVQATTWNNINFFSIFLMSSDEDERGRFNSEILRRWFCRINEVLKTPLLLIVDSQTTVDLLEGIPGVLPYFPKAWWKAVKKWLPSHREGELSDTNFCRWVFSDIVLRAGYDALYADTDIVWLAEPREYLKLGSGDFMNSVDGLAGKWSLPYPNMQILRQMGQENDDESVCCQGIMGHYNAGLLFMRATQNTLFMVDQIRKRILMGPCWGQDAMIWSMSQHCAPSGRVICRPLDAFRFSKWELLPQQMIAEASGMNRSQFGEVPISSSSSSSSGAGQTPKQTLCAATIGELQFVDPPAAVARWEAKKAAGLAPSQPPCGPSLAFALHLDSHHKVPMTDIVDAILGVPDSCAARKPGTTKTTDAAADDEGKGSEPQQVVDEL